MTRNVPNTSKAAYHDKERQKKAKHNKELILEFMAKYPTGQFTVRDLAACTRLGYRPTQKRVSDLKHEGRIKATGTDTEYDKEVEAYTFVSFQVQRKKPKSKHQLLKERLMTDWPLIYQVIMPQVEQDYLKQ